MGWLGEVGRWLAFFFRRGKFDADLEDEMRLHQELREREQVERGVSPEEAHYASQRRFGNKLVLREKSRDMWGWNWLETSLQDVRYGFRQLRRNPGFAAVAVITLALGIAVNTTIFSTVSLVLLKKPTVHDPGRLMEVSANNKAKGYNFLGISAPDFVAFRRQNDVFQGIAADANHSFILTRHGAPEYLMGAQVTADYFRVLGLSPALGRDFQPTEDEAGRNHVAILSNGLWKQYFASDRKVIGSVAEIDGEPYTVIGVMPPGTDLPIQQAQLWTPIVFTAKDLSNASRSSRYLFVFGRLKPGATIKKARAEMTTVAARIAHRHPNTAKGYSTSVLTLQEYMIRATRIEAGLTVLMGAVAFVLLIACANIAGLLLSRAAARQQEITVRAALGAARLRIIRQLLTESLLIALAGGGLGVIFGMWGIGFLRTTVNWNPYVLYLARNLRLDGRTLLFTVALTLGATILFGLAPALRASNPDLAENLKAGGRSRTEGFARGKLRSALVAAEIALSVVLLVGAGLFMESFLSDLRQNPGFNKRHVLTAEISLSGREYEKSPSRQAEFFERITRRVRDLPGVQSASATWPLPLSRWRRRTVKIMGRDAPGIACIYLVGSRYFQTMEIPLIKGREFSPVDDGGSPIVAVVNQAFAHKYFLKRDAIGRRILASAAHPAWAEIVGIVGNVKEWPGQPDNYPQVYEPYRQQPSAAMALVVRTGYDAAWLAPLLRRVVWSVDKSQPVENLMTMRQVAASAGTGGERFMSRLVSAFAALALILSAVGIYGVTAYSVAQRTHEIGIRMALGAETKDVLVLMLRQGGAVTAIGCAVGLAFALPLPEMFAAMFGRTPVDALLVLTGVVPSVAIVSLFATYTPARRAAKVGPMVALRFE